MLQLTHTPDAPRSLETDGPCIEYHSYDVNRHAGNFTRHGEFRPDIPRRRTRAPQDCHAWYTEQRQARRIHALITNGQNTGHMTARAINEILHRLLTLHPQCLDGY